MGRAARRAPAARRPDGPKDRLVGTKKKEKVGKKKEERKSVAPPRECRKLGAYGTSLSNLLIPPWECCTALRALCTAHNPSGCSPYRIARSPPPIVHQNTQRRVVQNVHTHSSLRWGVLFELIIRRIMSVHTLRSEGRRPERSIISICVADAFSTPYALGSDFRRETVGFEPTALPSWDEQILRASYP